MLTLRTRRWTDTFPLAKCELEKRKAYRRLTDWPPTVLNLCPFSVINFPFWRFTSPICISEISEMMTPKAEVLLVFARHWTSFIVLKGLWSWIVCLAWSLYGASWKRIIWRKVRVVLQAITPEISWSVLVIERSDFYCLWLLKDNTTVRHEVLQMERRRVGKLLRIFLMETPNNIFSNFDATQTSSTLRTS